MFGRSKLLLCRYVTCRRPFIFETICEVNMKNVLSRLLVSQAGLEALALRLPVGLIRAAHGSQKLFGG
ncbi:hypothetical protein MGMO_38c00060 [Methyloglobulus morosus KoM1]|uniref:Uncharacterized protein n=1 Tax=Methyloglobulus morosus KoM1 TaxID=1116472 RepID=V5C8J8_9GAMM|nr:hypothetical protein MGMO_38c00060 [Methyloglobulus morosus KoM1]